MELRKQGHAVYFTQYHLVLVTKYRRKIFNEGVKEYFLCIIKQIKDYYPEIDFDTINTDQDHAHIIVSIPPKMAVGAVVRIIKANTARAIRNKFPFLSDVYWGTDGIWSGGYFVSTVGVNEDIIRNYVALQGQEDSGQAKLVL